MLLPPAAACVVNYILAAILRNTLLNLTIAVVSMVVIIGKVNHSTHLHSQRD